MYVSKERDTCIAEVRPSIGDRIVIGEFVSTKKYTIFDFTALSRRLFHKQLSLFDPCYVERKHRRVLLEYLHSEISRPAKPSDTNYLMTQALAEYIRFGIGEKFDGVAFKSVQHENGKNFALFDNSTEDNTAFKNWTPEFNLKIGPEDVSIVEIEGVAYFANCCKN